jgi:hypothetical protein
MNEASALTKTDQREDCITIPHHKQHRRPIDARRRQRPGRLGKNPSPLQHPRSHSPTKTGEAGQTSRSTMPPVTAN